MRPPLPGAADIRPAVSTLEDRAPIPSVLCFFGRGSRYIGSAWGACMTRGICAHRIQPHIQIQPLWTAPVSTPDSEPDSTPDSTLARIGFNPHQISVNPYPDRGGDAGQVDAFST